MKKEKVKKTKPKKKFSLWRMLSYVGCYVFVTFAVAFVVVSVNSSTYSFTPPSLDDNETVQSSLLGNMVSNIMTVEDMTTSLGLTIQNGDTNINITGDVQLKIYEEFSGVEAKANLSVGYNGTVVDVQVMYTDKLYLTLDNRTFVLDLNDGFEGIFGILNVLGVELDLNLDDLMGSLDMSILDTLGDYITESTLENGYALSIDYNGLSATVVLDSEYNIVSVSAPSLSFDGWDISLNLGVESQNQGLVFDEVVGDTSLSPIFRLVECGLNTFKGINYTINTNINYDKYNFGFDAVVDGSDAKLLTNISGQNLAFYLKDGIGYGDFGAIKIKGGMDDINKVIDIVTDLVPDDMIPDFDIDMDMDTILGLVQKAISQNWNIVGDEDGLAFEFDGNILNITYQNDKISNIEFDICGVTGSISLAENTNSIVVPEQKYMQVGDLADFIRPVYNIVCLDRINATADIMLDGKTYDLNIMFDKATNRVSANTNVYNKVVKFDYFDHTLYLQIDDVRVCTPTSDVMGLVVYVLQNYCGDISVDDLKSAFENELTLDVEANKYSFAFGGVNLDFEITNDEISGLSVVVGDICAEMTLTYNDMTPLVDIDVDAYTTLDVTMENLQYIFGLVKEYIEGGEYNFDIDFEYGEYALSGYIGLNNNDLACDLNISAFGYDVRIIVSDKIGRVYIKDLAISCEYDTLAGLVAYVFKTLDINIDVDKYLANLPEFDAQAIEDLLNNVTLSYTNSTFVIGYEDITLNVRLGLNTIKNIFMTYKDFSVNIKPTYAKNVIIPNVEYIYIEDIVDILNSVKPIIQNKYLTANFEININNIEVSGVIKFDYTDMRLEATIHVLDQTINIDYIDGKIYIAYDGVKLACKTEDILDLIKGYIDIEDKISDLKSEDITADDILDKLALLSIIKTQNGFDITYDTYTFKLTLADGILSGLTYGEDVNITFDHSTPVFENIDTNAYQYVDLTYANVSSLVEKVKTYIESDEYYIDLSASYGEYGVNGWIGLKKGHIVGRLESTILNKLLQIDIVKDVVYIDYDGLKLQCALADYSKIAELLQSEWNITIPDLDLVTPLTMLYTDTNITFDDIQSILNKLTISNTGMTLHIEYERVSASIDLANYKVNSVVVQYDDLRAILKPTTAHTNNISGEYIKLVDVIDLVEVVLPIIENKHLTMTVSTNIKGVEIGAVVSLDHASKQVNVVLNVLNETINIRYQNGNIYIDFDGVKLACSTSDILDLIKGYMPDADIDEMLSGKTIEETVNDVLDILREISLSGTSNGFEIGYAEHLFNLEITNNILTSLTYGEDVNITFDHSAPVFEEIDTNAYQYVDLTYTNVSSLVDQVKTYIESDEYYIDLSASYGEYGVNGWIGLEKGHIVGRLESTILNKLLQIDIVKDVVYIDYDGLKLQCALADYSKIAELLQSEWNITIPDLDLVTPLTMLDTDTNITLDDVQSILNKLTISNTGMTLHVEYERVSASIDLANYKVNSIVVQYDDLRATLKPTTAHTNNISGEYIDIGSLTNVARAINKSMANMTMSGVLTVDIVFANEVNTLNINYGITYKDKDLRVYGNFTFKGLNVNLYYFDRTIYLDVVGMKIYASIDDYEDIIAWLNKTFELNIDIEKIKDSTDLSFDDIKLDFVKDWTITDEYISADVFENIHLDVYYGDTIEKVVFEAGDKGATIVCTSFDALTFDSIDKTQYSKYTIVTNTIDDILNTIKKKSFDISAVARVFENDQTTYNAAVTLAFDFENHFKAYGEANVVDLLDENGSVNFVASWDKYSLDDNRDYIFVNYNGMKLRMNSDALKEVLVLGLQILGVDPSILGFLEDVSDDFKVDSSNLNNIMPNLDMGNPLNMLRYIKSLNLTNSQFTLVLDGSFFGDGVADMEIVLHTNNGTIVGLDLNNIFVGGTETFNLAISLNPFESVPEIQDKVNYMDLSGASQLLKAVINTSSKKSYHITGAVKLNAANLIKKTVGVDMGVVIGDDGKTIIDVTLSNYPLYVGVNTEYSNYSAPINRMRTINMRFKDGYAYLRMYDAKYLSAGTYERISKVPVSYLIQNLSYYMQYILGFTDNIQAAIDEAITASQNYTGATDYSNILLDYNQTDNKHSLTLNLQELAHNDQLDTMEVGLTTVNSRETGRKDMLYRLDMNVIMLGDLIKITTDDEANLKLVDLNSTYDMTEANAFIQNYENSGYVTFGEYVSEGGKTFSKSNDKDVTITFYDQDNTATTVSGKVGSLINYPSVTETLADGRKFKGWYYYANSDKTKLKEWTHRNMPLNSMELYGIWENTYTVTLIDNDQTYMTYNLFKGEKLNLPDIENQFVETDGVRSGKEFAGWYDGILKRDELSIKTDVTLKAHWADATYYQITYIDGDQTTYKWVKEGSQVEVGSKSNYIGTYDDAQVVFDWRGWYNGDTQITSFVAEAPMTLVGKWEICSMDMARTLTIKDGDQVLSSTPQLIDYNIVVPENDKITYDTWYYLDADLTERYYIETMPDYDLTLYIANVYTVSIKYVDSITNGEIRTKTETYQVRQGTVLADVLPDPSRFNTHGTDGQIINIYDDNIHQISNTFEEYTTMYDKMPNCDFDTEELWIHTDRYYYDIVFDTNWNYEPRIIWPSNASNYVDYPSFTPETMRILEGETLDLSGSEYKPSCTMKGSFKTYDYSCSGWSTTIPDDGSNGGGSTSYTVNANDATNGVITLYVCWEKQ